MERIKNTAKRKKKKKTKTGLGGEKMRGDIIHLVHPSLDNLDVLHAHEGTLSLSQQVT